MATPAVGLPIVAKPDMMIDSKISTRRSDGGKIIANKQTPSTKTKEQSSNKIPRFKTSINCPIEDVAEIRKLLTSERISLAAEHPDLVEFWGPDYDRMMQDDWLVSRFLLRGQKRATTNGDGSQLYSNTMELIRECAKFRYEFRINGLTDSGEFPREWLSVDGIFNYKPDRAGNPTIYLRVKLHKVKLIETRELRYQFKRLLLYYLESCDRDLTNEPGRGICCVFDLSQATLENLDVELVSWMFRSFKSCGPKLLSYIIVYNIPWFLNATLKLLFGTIMARGNQQKIRFVYGSEILDYIHPNSLPSYMGLS